MSPPAEDPAADVREDRRAPARTARLRNRIPEPDEEPDLLGQYLAQISATPLLTAEDEVRLARGRRGRAPTVTGSPIRAAGVRRRPSPHTTTRTDPARSADRPTPPPSAPPP